MQKINPETYEKPSDFYKAAPGENRIRLVSDGYLYRKLGVRMQGHYVAQIIRDGEPINPALAKQEPKRQWGWVVFDYRTGSLKILETGSMMGDALAKLTKDPDYKKKDVLLLRRGEQLKTEYEVKGFAPESLELPEGVNRNSAEYRYLLAYFEPEVTRG